MLVPKIRHAFELFSRASRSEKKQKTGLWLFFCACVKRNQAKMIREASRKRNKNQKRKIGVKIMKRRLRKVGKPTSVWFISVPRCGMVACGNVCLKLWSHTTVPTDRYPDGTGEHGLLPVTFDWYWKRQKRQPACKISSGTVQGRHRPCCIVILTPSLFSRALAYFHVQSVLVCVSRSSLQVTNSWLACSDADRLMF